MSSILASRAMLTTLRIRQWSARKLDRKVTDEVNAAHHASADAGRYNKSLVAKDALAKIQTVANGARDFLYSQTSPWGDDGPRILSAKQYLHFTAGLAAKRDEFADAVSAFVAAYPATVADARTRLNGLFNESDYPAPADIAARFSFDTEILPIPDSADFRVDLAQGQADDIRAAIEARTADVLQNTLRDAYARVADAVGKMAEKLSAYKQASAKGERSEGVFRDSLVDNVRELAAILPALNLTDDPNLAAVADRITRELTAVDAEHLRIDARARATVAASAAAIAAQVGAYMQ